MQAEIIAIGDEILVGQTVDTNSAFIARELNRAGVEVYLKRVVADTEEAITDALNKVHPATQIVMMTGGLGPTKDDITKNTLLQYFGGSLQFQPAVYENIKNLFRGFNREPQPVHKQQAYLPTSCTPLLNKMGTASGMHFKKGAVHYFSMPGVPYETEHIVQDRVIPWLRENLAPGYILHKTLLTQGIPESDLAELLADWENALPDFISLAYLPSPGMVKLRLTSRNKDKSKGSEELTRQSEKLRERLGNDIFGEDAQSLEEIIGLELKRRGQTLATAESCTGGYIAHLITSIPGSSGYFQGSIVSYTNKAKQELLGVQEVSLAQNGAVSEAVVKEMAVGAQGKLHADYAIATSGIAGPNGGTDQKPVGTIWIAVATPAGVKTRRYVFGRNRQRNIRKTALMALDLLRREIQKNEKRIVG